MLTINYTTILNGKKTTSDMSTSKVRLFPKHSHSFD